MLARNVSLSLFLSYPTIRRYRCGAAVGRHRPSWWRATAQRSLRPRYWRRVPLCCCLRRRLRSRRRRWCPRHPRCWRHRNRLRFGRACARAMFLRVFPSTPLALAPLFRGFVVAGVLFALSFLLVVRLALRGVLSLLHSISALPRGFRTSLCFFKCKPVQVCCA